MPLGFTSAGQLHAQRLEIIQLTSGSRELDKILEGCFLVELLSLIEASLARVIAIYGLLSLNFTPFFQGELRQDP